MKRIVPRNSTGVLGERWETTDWQHRRMFEIEIADDEWVRYVRLLKAVQAIENGWAERAIRGHRKGRR